MTYLGSIRGSGRVLVDGEEVGEARYSISVFQPRHLKVANGTLEADDSVIWAAYQASRGCALVLEDGESVEFVYRQSSVGSGIAAIDVSGPVPGFRSLGPGGNAKEKKRCPVSKVQPR